MHRLVGPTVRSGETGSWELEPGNWKLGPMKYRAVFRCASGCPGQHSIWQPIYHCPTCGGLLQVQADAASARDEHVGGEVMIPVEHQGAGR